MSFDPRVTPARPDLAAAHLRGQVEAARFVDGTEFEVFDPVAPVRRSPVPDALLETEALKGERVTIYDQDGEGWGWGQLHSDRYVGWLPMNALRAPGPEPTHKVVGAADDPVSRTLHQGPAGRGAAAGLPPRHHRR